MGTAAGSHPAPGAPSRLPGPLHRARAAGAVGGCAGGNAVMARRLGCARITGTMAPQSARTPPISRAAAVCMSRPASPATIRSVYQGSQAD